jgi:RNA polymerase sigma-70 factor (ECF subfamily)
MSSDQISFDEHLLESLKTGNKRSIKFIFNSHYDRIVAFCVNFVGDIYVAEDISQDAFINLWLNRSKIFKPAGILSFLYTCAKSKCLNYIRDRTVREQFQSDILAIKELNLNEHILDSFDFDSYDFSRLEKLFREAVDELPARSKEVFMKSRFECKRNSEIAEDLNITIQAVEANITRTLKKLRDRLSDYLPILITGLVLKCFLI